MSIYWRNTIMQGKKEVQKFNKITGASLSQEQLEALKLYLYFQRGNLNIKSEDDLKIFKEEDTSFDLKELENVEVKLRYDLIKNQKCKLSSRYLDFIEQNKNQILHISLENATGNFVTLQEDPHKMWLFVPDLDLLYQNAKGEWVDFYTAIDEQKE